MTIQQAVENYQNGNLAEAKKRLKRNPMETQRVASEMLGPEHGRALARWAVGGLTWQELCDVAAKGVES